MTDRVSHQLTGLEQYIPNNSRETLVLGRFPMRNRYISNYIFQKTGKRRTAKQVGSRLQQLRDTCGGRQRQSAPFIALNMLFILNSTQTTGAPPFPKAIFWTCTV